MCVMTMKNSCDFNAYPIIKIFLVPRNAYVVPKDQDKFVFYVNHYIDWDQLHSLYDSN